MSAAYPPRMAIADSLRPVVQNPVPGSASYLRYSSTSIRRLKLQSYADTASRYLPYEDSGHFLFSNIHLVVCLTTGPKPLPKRALHTVRPRASSFKCEYPLISLRSFSSFLRLLPRLPVTSMSPSIFPSITCCRRKFLRKM